MAERASMSDPTSAPSPVRPVAAIVLAAGRGTRMRSDLHKVLHPVAGRPMLAHLLATVDALGAAARVVVVGAGRDQVEAAVAGQGVTVAVQELSWAPPMRCSRRRRRWRVSPAMC